MERNDFPAGNPPEGQTGGTGAGGGFGNAGNTLGTQGYGAASSAAGAGAAAGAATTDGTASDVGRTTGTSESAGFADRARDIAGVTQDKLADVGANVRERMGTAKDSLADALESGATKLRQRVHGSQAAGEQGGQLAAATPTGTVTTADGRVVQIGDKVASGMDATADWIRDADLDSLKVGIERQVKEHPGRTLLMAVGLGYLLGKAFNIRK